MDVIAARSWRRRPYLDVSAGTHPAAARDGFGPEYDRAIEERGDRRDAEAHLREREERRDALDIRPLTPASRERYAQEWGAVQARFVDEPVGAVAEADRRGHAAFAAHDRGEASTEDLRRAMVHYRALFDELLGSGSTSEVRS